MAEYWAWRDEAHTVDHLAQAHSLVHRPCGNIRSAKVHRRYQECAWCIQQSTLDLYRLNGMGSSSPRDLIQVLTDQVKCATWFEKRVQVFRSAVGDTSPPVMLACSCITVTMLKGSVVLVDYWSVGLC